jgi:hypothetical protein
MFPGLPRTLEQLALALKLTKPALQLLVVHVLKRTKQLLASNWLVPLNPREQLHLCALFHFFLSFAWVTSRGQCRLGKAYQVPDKSPINITRAINATEITSKLNLRIRLPYACAQLISPSPAGLRLAAPITLILICEKVTPLNQLLPYFFPRVRVASRYGASR